MKPLVSLVQYTGSPDSLKEIIELCGGFEKLDKNAGVLIKPNLVTWDNQYTIAPFGVFTTTRLVEDLVIMLKDYGVRDISIGEGSVEFQKGTGTMDAYTGLGYNKLIKKYGVTFFFGIATQLKMLIQVCWPPGDKAHYLGISVNELESGSNANQ